MALPIYVVVYGSEWEDLMYFSDLEKAKKKLIVQTVGKDACERFCPTLYEYNDNNGVYVQCKRYWIVDPKAQKDDGLIEKSD